MSFRWKPLSGTARQPRASGVRTSRRAKVHRRPQLDCLEDRTLLSSSIPLSSTTWTPIGPAGIQSNTKFGPFGGNGGLSSGRISGVAADPSNPNVLYIAATGGGVWKTTNGG